MAGVLDELCDLLIAEGVAVEGEVFVGWAPATPARCIVLRDYLGFGPLRSLGGGAAWATRPRIQVVTRDAQYVNAHDTAWQVWRVFDALVNAELPGTDSAGNPATVRFLQCKALTDPFSMGPDDNGRQQVACNFEAWREVPA